MPHTFSTRWMAFSLVALLAPTSLLAQGVMLPTIGTVNRSMGGAAVAAPLDAIGAVYWNPATQSALPSSELGFGFEMLLSDLEISSTVTVGPGAGSGSTKAEPGVVPIPAIGWVHQLQSNPRMTVGLGLVSVAGFKTNFPTDPTNPVLRSPAAGGVGRIFTEAEFLQMAPTISYALTDKLSIGFGPTITMGKLAIDPFIFASPNTPPPTAQYPSGRGTRVHWGGGAQLGMYYITDNCWHFGASIKSPQWMETFRWHSEDDAGAPRVLKTKVDLPMIIAMGVAYSGFEDITFAMDLRYFDYKNTDGWGSPAGFDGTGAVTGLGWSNVFALATGVQYRVNDAMYVRAGYTYTQSPIDNSDTFFNLGAPLYYQHMASFGGSMNLSRALSMNFAYSYLFDDSKTGPIPGAPAGSTVTSTTSAHLVSMGITVRY